MRRLFPPDGEVAYAGIGIATANIDGKVFVTDVYDGGPAAKAGVLAGDEIAAVDGEPFDEIGSFAGKAGRVATLSLKRTAEAEPMAVAVEVARIEPGRAFVEATRDSARVVERGNRRIGVIHLWSYTSGAVTGVIYDAIATGELKDVDGLVLDLRSRWGGAPGDAAETFLGRTAEMRLIDRDGKVEVANARFHKPVVAIIDGGTRSGMEILAYALKQNGVPLVGAPTAGDVLAGTAFLLPDDSLLELAVQDVLVNGERLEANPIAPDVAVPFDVRYADGRDPQFDAAVAELMQRLEG
jgi:C-terminal processing protease CtpA/Prc